MAVAFPFIPGAFVALSQSQLANISLRPRARIICAGAYHNFILALLLSVAAYICSDQLFIYVGDYGRSVTEISEVGCDSKVSLRFSRDGTGYVAN